ncbi:hypothetical protein [Streptomyces sp. V4I2]|nr:hypothetical protein [Streptomyces sp. V4I2]MDQ1051740.1 hypothetical protein [Streptomyces sp. V4I2]
MIQAGRVFAAASLRIVASVACRVRACWYFVPDPSANLRTLPIGGTARRV